MPDNQPTEGAVIRGLMYGVLIVSPFWFLVGFIFWWINKP